MDGHIDFQSPFLTPAAASTPDSGESSASSSYSAFGYGSGSSTAVAVAPASPVAAASSSSSAAASSSAYDTYAEMFPSLPTSNRPPQPAYTPAPISFSSKIREHTERFQIETPQLRPSGIGDKSHSEIIKAIMQETDTKIESSMARNGTMTVLITGKAEKAAVAKKKLLSALSKQYELKIEVAKEHLSSLIGKGGSKLKALQEKTGARITVPKADDASDFVTLSGDKAAVEAARREIQEFLKEKTNFVRENLNIEAPYQPFVYGPGHENVKNIAQETGAKIHIPPQDAEDQTIVVSGPRESVAEALKRIQALYVEKKRTIKSIEVKVNKKQHRFVIGPKGVNIQEILQNTGCSVTVPPADDPSDTIKVSGDDSKLLVALQLVLEKANSVCLEEINVDGAQMQRYVRLKARPQIKELEKGTKALISFLPTSIDVQGPKEEVEAVRSSVISLLTELKKLKFDEVDVAPELRKFIIGKNGQGLKKFKTDYNVDLFIPNEDEEKQSVLLAGEKDKVKIVKDQLQKTLKELANLTVVEIKVDPKFHKTIVGKKGETIKKLNDDFENCSIKVPTPEENSEVVVLRGPKDEVENLRKVVVKLVEDTRQHELLHSYQVEIQIDKKAMKYIVGKAGATINKIREQYDVKIEIKDKEEEAPAAPAKEEPKKEEGKGKKGKKEEEGKKEDKKGEKAKPKESDTEKVVITGVKQNVEAAKETLIAKAKEITEGGGFVTVELNIEQKYHGNLIGSQGKFVKSLMERHSINVRFPPGDAPSDIVVLSGMKKSVEKAQEELMELLEYEKSIGFVQHVTADNAVLKQVMGSNSRQKVRQIMDATRTQIEFEGNNKEGNKLVIKGTAQGTAEAKKLLEKHISEIANSVTEEIEIDTQFHGMIIGAKGARIRELSEKFGGVDIRFPTDKTSKIIRLTGSRKNVDGVKATILEIVKSSDDDKASQTTRNWELDSKYYPGLRDYLKNFGNEIKVNVTFPKDESNTLVLKGKDADIDAAIARFQENLQETLTVKIPRALHRPMLAGGKIKELNQSLNVVIRFPDRDNNSNDITIRGKASVLAEAEKALLALADEAKARQEERVVSKAPKDSTTEVLKVNPEYVGRVIGKGGNNIRKIQDLSGVKIDIKKDSGEISISGSKEGIEFAMKDLKDTIAELESRTTEILHVDPKYHARIAGNRFSNIFQIQDDYDVTILLPKNNSDEISVSGNKDDVAAAINYLKETVKEIEFESKNEVREEKPKREQPREQSQGRANGNQGGSRQAIQANDPFFAPPPTQANVDKTSVWGARMS